LIQAIRLVAGGAMWVDPDGGNVRRVGVGTVVVLVATGTIAADSGLSTGARTAEGVERIRRAVTRCGYYSKAAKTERAEACFVGLTRDRQSAATDHRTSSEVRCIIIGHVSR
jgi:hypothetical protein